MQFPRIIPALLLTHCGLSLCPDRKPSPELIVHRKGIQHIRWTLRPHLRRTGLTTGKLGVCDHSCSARALCVVELWLIELRGSFRLILHVLEEWMHAQRHTSYPALPRKLAFGIAYSMMQTIKVITVRTTLLFNSHPPVLDFVFSREVELKLTELKKSPRKAKTRGRWIDDKSMKIYICSQLLEPIMN
eukprot:IDg6999t1